MKIVVDSSVFLSIYLDDSNSKDALQMISRFLQENVVLVVPLVVYFEVINTLKRKSDYIEVLNNFILDISLNESIILAEFTKDDILKKIYKFAERINLKTNDLIIYLTAKKYDCKHLLTLDYKLNKRWYEI